MQNQAADYIKTKSGNGRVKMEKENGVNPQMIRVLFSFWFQNAEFRENRLTQVVGRALQILKKLNKEQHYSFFGSNLTLAIYYHSHSVYQDIGSAFTNLSCEQ